MTTEQWHPEINVTIALAKTCVAEQFPELLPITAIKCIGSGWDNKVFLVNEKIIFRFPQRNIAVQLIERENIVLNYLHQHSKITLEIPNPQYFGQVSDHYPYPFHGYHIIAGTPGYQADLTEKERSTNLAPLANFLKQLHSITAAQAITIGVRQQVYNRTETERVVATLYERVEKIIARKICKINKKCFDEEMLITQKTKLPMEDQVLVHGDLYSRHLMFTQKKLTGIIDWGDVGINNRCVDLAVIFSFYPDSCQQKFLKIYGKIEANTWQYARFLGLHSALTSMPYGHDIGDSELVTESIKAINRINTDLIIR